MKQRKRLYGSITSVKSESSSSSVIQTIKARTLYANLHPGVEFNDLTICNNAGVYKNGNILHDEENNYLFNLLNNGEIKSIKYTTKDKFILYPNPIENQLNISYNIEKDGYCIIYDILGNEKQRIRLSSKSNHISTLLKSYTSGVYSCKFWVGGVYSETQKIVVE